MRLVVFLMCIIFLGVELNAQIVRGYVKTQGRPNKPGKALAGVTINWRGNINAVVSSSEGKFSVSFPDKKNGDAVYLVNVRKVNYELIDPELIGRPLIFSTEVPIEIVMVSSAELEANRKRIRKNAYRKAEANYQKKVRILEKQTKESEITLEQYQLQLQQLQDNYDKYVSLIDGMADRYARTDYDHLNLIDREINICIENGDLDRADSLIHTVFDPLTVLEKSRKTKAEIESRMQLAQEIIDKANEDKDAIRKDSTYAKRVISLCDNLADEYINQGEKKKAIDCYRQSLSIRRILYGENHDEIKITIQKIQSLQ